MAKPAVAEKPKPGSGANPGGAAKPGAAKPGAVKPGAAPAGSAGMDKAELKQVLKFARRDTVRVAFAQGGDGKAVIVVDRRKNPRALLVELKDGAPGSRNHRFGTAMADPEDAKLLRFTVNKSAGGMVRKLVLALKGTGFSKVEIGSADAGRTGGAARARDGRAGGAAGRNPDGGAQP